MLDELLNLITFTSNQMMSFIASVWEGILATSIIECAVRWHEEIFKQLTSIGLVMLFFII